MIDRWIDNENNLVPALVKQQHHNIKSQMRQLDRIRSKKGRRYYGAVVFDCIRLLLTNNYVDFTASHTRMATFKMRNTFLCFHKALDTWTTLITQNFKDQRIDIFNGHGDQK